MPQRACHRRRQPGGLHAAAELMGHDNPVLALQRSIGNRAVAQIVAREAVRTGTVEIAGVGKIKVKGGNLEEWDGKGAPDTVELTSQKGKHSAKLEKLATAHTKTDVKVMIAAAGKAGENLNVGGGTQLEIKDGVISGYSVADGVEMWRVSDFTNVKRTKVTHTIGPASLARLGRRPTGRRALRYAARCAAISSLTRAGRSTAARWAAGSTVSSRAPGIEATISS